MQRQFDVVIERDEYGYYVAWVCRNKLSSSLASSALPLQREPHRVLQARI
jgi:hypothetical protein